MALVTDAGDDPVLAVLTKWNSLCVIASYDDLIEATNKHDKTATKCFRFPQIFFRGEELTRIESAGKHKLIVYGSEGNRVLTYKGKDGFDENNVEWLDIPDGSKAEKMEYSIGPDFLHEVDSGARYRGGADVHVLRRPMEELSFASKVGKMPTWPTKVQALSGSNNCPFLLSKKSIQNSGKLYRLVGDKLSFVSWQ